MPVTLAFAGDPPAWAAGARFVPDSVPPWWTTLASTPEEADFLRRTGAQAVRHAHQAPPPGHERLGLAEAFARATRQVAADERLRVEGPSLLELALEQLRAVEWRAGAGLTGKCPKCGGVRGEGEHAASCTLDVAIRRLESFLAGRSV